MLQRFLDAMQAIPAAAAPDPRGNAFELIVRNLIFGLAFVGMHAGVAA